MTAELVVLRNGKDELEARRASIESRALARVKATATASIDKLQSQIDAIEGEMRQIALVQQKHGSRIAILASLPLGKEFVDQLKRDVEMSVLDQERDYLKRLVSLARAGLNRDAAIAEQERLRKMHVSAFAELNKIEDEQALIREGNFWKTRVFFWSEEYARYQALQKSYDVQHTIHARASENYQRQRKIVESITISSLPRFEIAKDQIERALSPLYDGIADRERRDSVNLVRRVSGPVIEVVPTAALILLLIILVPIAIKVVLYFIVAPWVSRFPPIRLLPTASGSVLSSTGEGGAGDGKGKVSAVSLPIVLREDQELLVQPEYLQSTSLDARKTTKWLLNGSIPFSSLLSGMYMLTRVSPSGGAPVVISSTRDPFMEVGIIELADGAAFVCQPRSLVGVIQDRRTPIRITRHWRLGNLQSWLTLQLRFLVFHGAGQLVLKGCRGIRVEPAGTGRLINQAATLGFSANLAYANTRCETFVSYWSGKEDLFNDLFTGQSGVYAYEEMPDLKRATGIGRHLEGFTDAILKLVGV